MRTQMRASAFVCVRYRATLYFTRSMGLCNFNIMQSIWKPKWKYLHTRSAQVIAPFGVCLSLSRCPSIDRCHIDIIHKQFAYWVCSIGSCSRFLCRVVAVAVYSEQQFWHHIKISSLPSSKVRRQTTEKLLVETRFTFSFTAPTTFVYLPMCQPRWQYSWIKTLKMSTKETKVIVFGAPTTRTPRLLIK